MRFFLRDYACNSVKNSLPYASIGTPGQTEISPQPFLGLFTAPNYFVCPRGRANALHYHQNEQFERKEKPSEIYG